MNIAVSPICVGSDTVPLVGVYSVFSAFFERFFFRGLGRITSSVFIVAFWVVHPDVAMSIVGLDRSDILLLVSAVGFPESI